MRHAYGNANGKPSGDGHGDIYAHPDSPGYGYTDSQPDVHAGTDNNTFRLE
jgi:hypothetical protein